MKKIIFGISTILIVAGAIFIGCNKKSNEVTPTPSPKEVKAGNLRLSTQEGVFSISTTESTGETRAIVFNSSGSISIRKINVGAGSNTATIQKISVTPSEKVASQIGGGGSCPSLGEIESLIGRISNSSISTSDACTLINFVACFIQNPSQYGVSDESTSRFIEELTEELDELEMACQMYGCSSCGNLKRSVKAPVVEEKSEFTFDGTTYSGKSSCNESSDSESYYISANEDYFSYSKSGNFESVSVKVNGDTYFSSSSSSISFDKNGNTVTISASVRKSSSSSSSTTKSVSATIRCK